MEINQIRKKLEFLSDEKYRLFSSSLILNNKNILGVRLPLLKNFAKELKDMQNFEEFLSSKPLYMEETLLKGLLIGFLKEDIDKILNYVEIFVPKIDNWAVCDSFCSGLKITKKHKKKVFDFIKKYAYSEYEFEKRFFLVMLTFHYIDEEYSDEIFNILDSIKVDSYYSKMAAAWLLSVLFVKFQNKTTEYIINSKLDYDTLKKAVRKIIESNRIDKKTKIQIKNKEFKFLYRK